MKASKIRGLATFITLAVFALLFVGALGCAPKASTASDGLGLPEIDETAVVFSWSDSSNCGTCHVTEQASEASILCQTGEQDVSKCATCHSEDETAMKTVHEGVLMTDNPPRRLSKTHVTDENCLSCHYETKEDLIKATNGVVAVTDKEGLQVNPHDPGSTGTSHNGIDCASCHNLHQSADIQSTAQMLCKSCHHEDVYECYTARCHVGADGP